MGMLFAHIGTQKTGTKTLQHFLYGNRDKLAEHNLIYPQYRKPPGPLGHHAVAFKLAKKKVMGRKALSGREIQQIFEEINCALEDHKNVLLSSEDFGWLSLRTCPQLPSLLRNKVSKANQFRIIVYLRRQDLFLRSYYGHMRKGYRLWRGDLDLRYARRNIYLPYSNLLERWAAVFGRENIVVRPFETESLTGGDLIEDFCEHLSLTGFQGDREPRLQKANSGFTLRELQAIEFIMDSVSGPSEIVSKFAQRFINRFSAALQLRGGGAAFMSPGVARAILEMSSADNQEIARTYLNRDQLFLNERISNEFEPPRPLNKRGIARIEAALEAELRRFNTEASADDHGGDVRSFQPLRMRAHMNRKQWKIGSSHVSNGRLLRMSEQVIKGLRSRLNF